MTPVSISSSSSSGLAGSFATSASAAQQQLKIDSERRSEAPPAVMHRAAKRSRNGEPLRISGFATLPKMLLYSMKQWLTDKETLPLIRSSHHLEQELQGYYRLRLRPSVARCCISPIVSHRDTVNLLPVVVGMGVAGEATFQNCLSLKKNDLPDGEYSRTVIEMFDKRLTEIESGEELTDISAGTALALGGSRMPAVNRDAMLAGVLSTYIHIDQNQRIAMISGLCLAFGGRNGRPADFMAVLDRILTSHALFDANGMGRMVQSLCRFLGGAAMSPVHLRAVTEKIMGLSGHCANEQIQAMITSVFLAVGGGNMAVPVRDILIGLIFDRYVETGNMPSEAIMRGTCAGLGGPDMRRSDIDAVLARIFGGYATCGGGGMGWAISGLCGALGGPKMSSELRDLMLSTILGSSRIANSSNPFQRGRMIWGVVHALGGFTAGAKQLTEKNLHAVVEAILKAQATCSTEHMSAMWRYLISTVGAPGVSSGERNLLVERFLESRDVDDILGWIKSIRRA